MLIRRLPSSPSHRNRRRLAIATSTLALLLACGDSGGGDSDSASESDSSGESGEESSESSSSTQTSETSETSETGEVIEIGLTISENPDMSIAPFGDVDAPGATATRITVYEDGVEVLSREVGDIDPDGPEGVVRTFLWGLHADSDYTVIAEADLPEGLGVSPEVAFSTGSLPAGMPTLTVDIHDEARAHRGLMMFSVRADGTQVYLGVDPGGEVAWYHETGGTGNKLNGDLKVMPDGRFQIFRPGGFQIIERWGEVVQDNDASFHHDLSPMPNGNFIALQRDILDIDVSSLGGVVGVQVDRVSEVTATGTEVNTWLASDYLDTDYYPSDLSLGGDPLDWTHGNAAYYDAENSRVLFSARHLHWVVAIDWPSGDVLWRMGPGGDFTLSGAAEDWFYAQHAPEPDGEGRMVIYDNGNERPNSSPYSRGVVVEYDDDAMTAEIVWEHLIVPQTNFLGDADRMENGNILMCAGGVLQSTDPIRLIEATGDESAEVVWQLLVEGGGNVYRATSLESLEQL